MIPESYGQFDERSCTDRELIYTLFDMVVALSDRLCPGEEIHAHPIADHPGTNDGLPVGMNDVFWLYRK